MESAVIPDRLFSEDCTPHDAPPDYEAAWLTSGKVLVWHMVDEGPVPCAVGTVWRPSRTGWSRPRGGYASHWWPDGRGLRKFDSIEIAVDWIIRYHEDLHLSGDADMAGPPGGDLTAAYRSQLRSWFHQGKIDTDYQVILEGWLA